MTKLDLDAIAGRAREAKDRADRATPGPWSPVAGSMNGPFGVCTNSQIVRAVAALIEKQDAAVFIASARTDVPALAADVRALVERVRELEENLSAYDEALKKDRNLSERRAERVRELEERAAAGPVMPETPSLCILASMCAAGWGDHWIGTERQEAVYRAIRAALMEEDAVTKT